MRKIIARDVNSDTPTSYDIELWVDRKRLAGGEDATGVPSSFTLYVIGEYNGNACPGIPDIGWEIMDFDQDFYGPNLHKYIRSGIVVYPTETPIPGTKWIEVQVETGYARQLNMPLPGITLDQANDALRAAGAIEQAVASFGLTGTWDTSTQVETDGFITYADPTTYPETHVYTLIDAISTDPGQEGVDMGYPVPKRFWYVSGEFVDPAHPLTSEILRVFHYYSSTQIAREPVPLTDRSDKMAYYSFDDFSRSAQSTTNMGTAPTGQAWAQLIGVWGITGEISGTATEAYMSTSIGQNVTVLEGSIADGEVSVRLATYVAGQGLAFRVSSHPATGYKWQGFAFYGVTGGYRVSRYVAGTMTNLATYTGTLPSDGDVLKVVAKGSLYKFYLNGVLLGTITDTFNQTATLSGLYASTGVGNLARWDDFGLWAKGANYRVISWPKDGTGIANIIAIKGPGSDAAPVSWSSDDGVGVEGANDGDLTKTLKPDLWQAATVYATGTVIRSTTLDGYDRVLEGAGGTSGATEPTWNTTEGGTTSDNGLTWRTRTWDAGTHSEQVITDDGGRVSGRVSQVRKVQDGFDRDDNTAIISKAPSGQDWAVIGTGVFGIRGAVAYPVSGSGARYAVVDSDVATAIIEVKFPTVVVGQRLAFRVRDAANLWFLEQQATAYKLYKRSAGSDTLMGTYTVTPAAGDVLKVSCAESVIKVYRNGAGPVITVTDAFNLGATQHGFGTASSNSATFDDFSVWQTYSSWALGIGAATTVTSFADIEFGWLLDAATRIAQPVESGSVYGAPVTYNVNDVFDVQVQLVAHPSGTTQDVHYFYNGADVRMSTTHPTITEDAPYYAQGAIYHPGATISDVTIKRFTYGIYQDDESVRAYGPMPLPDTIQRDDADTDAKRRAYKDAFFSRHAGPSIPVQLETTHEYHQGRLVLINNSRFGWINKLPVLVSVTPDWSGNLRRPIYKLVLGDSVEEWGDEEAAGFLLKNVLNAGMAPPIPTGFGQSQGVKDGPGTVNHNFTWDKPRASERFMEIQLRPINQPAWEPKRLPASGGTGTIGELPPTTPMTAKIRSIDYNNKPSSWSAAIDLVTARLPVPPPRDLEIDDEVGQDGFLYQSRTSATGQLKWLPPLDDFGNFAFPDSYKLTLQLTGGPTTPDDTSIVRTFPGTSTGGPVDGLTVGSTYKASIVAIHGGFPSAEETLDPFLVPLQTVGAITLTLHSNTYDRKSNKAQIQVDRTDSASEDIVRYYLTVTETIGSAPATTKEVEFISMATRATFLATCGAVLTIVGYAVNSLGVPSPASTALTPTAASATKPPAPVTAGIGKSDGIGGSANLYPYWTPPSTGDIPADLIQAFEISGLPTDWTSPRYAPLASSTDTEGYLPGLPWGVETTVSVKTVDIWGNKSDPTTVNYTPRILGPNIVKYGDFDVLNGTTIGDPQYFMPLGWTRGVPSGSDTSVQADGRAHDGRYALGFAGANVAPGGGNQVDATQPVILELNTTYQLNYDVIDEGDDHVNFSLGYVDDADPIVISPGNPEPDGLWHPVETTFTTPSSWGASNHYLEWFTDWSDGGNYDFYYRVDNLVIRKVLPNIKPSSSPDKTGALSGEAWPPSTDAHSNLSVSSYDKDVAVVVAQAASGQTEPLFQGKDSSGSTVFSVDDTGLIETAAAEIGGATHTNTLEVDSVAVFHDEADFGNGIVANAIALQGALTLDEIPAQAAPGAAHVVVYSKSDDRVWVRAHTGGERTLGFKDEVVGSITGTTPINVGGTTTIPVISIDAASGSGPGSMSAANFTKLAGVATGATANQTDAYLLDRAHHTGTQLMATVSDAGGAATKNVGTTAGTVAAGDDSRITGAAQKASNLSDLASASTARTNLGLGTSATHPVGDFLQTANNLSDVTAATARTNLGLGTSATHPVADFLQTSNNLSDVTAATARTNLGLGTAATKDVAVSGNASSTQVVKGDDTRLTDSRTPTSHGSTHGAGGTDAISDLTNATAANTASVIVKRDASKRFQAADPSAAQDVSTKNYTDTQDALAIAKTLVTAKGDLIGASASGTPARIAVGTNNSVPTADSSASTGITYRLQGQSGVSASSSASNTTSPVTIASYTLAANELTLLGTAEFNVFGRLSSGLSATSITINAKIAGATILSTSMSVAGSLSRLPWNLTFLLQARTIGATGTVWCYLMGAQGATPLLPATNASTPTTIDTTVSRLLEIEVVWAAANASNTISSDITTLQYLR